MSTQKLSSSPKKKEKKEKPFGIKVIMRIAYSFQLYEKHVTTRMFCRFLFMHIIHFFTTLGASELIVLAVLRYSLASNERVISHVHIADSDKI